MIRLCTLGEAVIRIGRRHYGPEAEHAFAATLFLASQPGRRVPRQALLDLIWPRVPDDSRRHNLRQLLYKLRRAGVSCEVEGAHLTIPAEAVTADYDPYFSASVSEGEGTYARVPFGTYLAGYSPSLSPAYAEWVEHRRGEVHGQIRRALLSAIVPLKHRGEWPEVERLARRVLELDELNEEATLALAEATAMSGSKAAAVAMLDRYVEELGPGATDIRIPASVLRKRISQPAGRTSTDHRDLLFGRETLIAEVNSAIEAVHGSRSVPVLCYWGETGVGKTRLLTEIRLIAELRGMTCLALQGDNSAASPLKLVHSLASSLLGSPGALGCDPESYRLLSRFVAGEPLRESALGSTTAQAERDLGDALVELLNAVTIETRLFLLLDDFHRFDDGSQRVFASMIALSRSAPLIAALTARNEVITPLEPIRDLVSFAKVTPLTRTNALLLIRHCYGDVPDGVLSRIASLSGGNPLFLKELAAQWRSHGDVDQLTPTLAQAIDTTLDRIPHIALRVLQALSHLGAHASTQNLCEVLQLSADALLESLDILEGEGLLDVDALRVRHPLVGDLATNRLRTHSSHFLHRRIAHALGASASPNTLSALASCLAHYKAAGDTESGVIACINYSKALVLAGLVDEAARTLRAGLSFCRDVQHHQLILEHLVKTLSLVGDWGGVLEAWRTRAKLDAISQVDLPSHSPAELAAIEASWRVETDTSRPLAQLLRCASDERADIEHRHHAIAFGLALADNANAAGLRQELYSLSTTLPATTELERIYKDQAGVIYWTSVGDKAQALQCVHALLRQIAHAPPHIRQRSLRHASTAQRAFGNHAATEALLNDAVAEAVRLGLRDQAALAYQHLAMAALDRSDHARALRALEHARHQSAGHGDTLFHMTDALIQARAAIIDGRPHDALETLGSREEILRHPNLRERSSYLATWLRARLAASTSFVARADDIDFLVRIIRERVHSLTPDYIAFTIWLSMRRSAPSSTVEAFVREYCSQHRPPDLPFTGGFETVVQVDLTSTQGAGAMSSSPLSVDAGRSPSETSVEQAD